MKKLNFGCGTTQIMDGWINIDLVLPANMVLDATKRFPFQDDSVDRIYSEHFIEHLGREGAEAHLKECYRVLKEDGAMRIATPDLDYLVERYQKDWNKQPWLETKEHGDHSFIKNKCQMLNYALRFWGHQYVFNQEDLVLLLREIGFKVSVEQWRKSPVPEFKNLERRRDSRLILEAKKQ